MTEISRWLYPAIFLTIKSTSINPIGNALHRPQYLMILDMDRPPREAPSDDPQAYTHQLTDLLNTARHDENYDAVKVLLIFWEVDPNNLPNAFEVEVNALGDIFSRVFKYNVEYYTIPLKSPTLQLQSRIIQLLLEDKTGGKKRLLILYYGGHGSDKDVDGKAVWAPSVSSSLRIFS